MDRQKVIDYFEGDELAADAWINKYAKEGDETPDDMHKRMAIAFADTEAKYPNPITEEEIYNLFKDFKYIIPGGSVMSAIGETQLVSYSNCTVLNSPEDSISSIMNTGRDMANLYKRRAGVGIDISNLRPIGAKVRNAAKSTSGPVSFMEFYSFITNTIAMSSRRGALLISMKVEHPDIVDFITSKQDLSKITGANISIQVSDEFMSAVQKNKDFILRYPVDFNVDPKLAEKLPYNELIKIGEGFEAGNQVYLKKVRAKEIWDTFIKCAHRTAEPGLLFRDEIWNYSPEGKYPKFQMVTTNPCFTGETYILTADGYKTFNELWAKRGYGDEVYRTVFINEAGEGVGGRMWSNGYKHIIRIVFNNDKYIECTPNHIFKLIDNTECEAQHLLGKVVKGFDGNNAQVTKLIDNGELQEVFDFNLNGGNHWGVVGGLIVHNCGEQPLGAWDSCRLLHINLANFVNNPFTERAEIDLAKLKEVATIAVRLGDDIVDMEIDRIKKMQEKFLKEESWDEYNLWENFKNIGLQGRRVGVGITGLADMVAEMNYIYGSSESKQLIELVMSTIFKAELKSTVQMAKERGKFEGWNKEYEDTQWTKFVKTEYPEDYNEMMEVGRRNLSFSTVAPTGTVSLLGRVSSGIEPVFMPFYTRRRKATEADTKVDYVDNNGVKFVEYTVVHPLFLKWCKMNNYNNLDLVNPKDLQKLFEVSPYKGGTAEELAPIDRIEIQSIAQVYTTSAISSTINLPEETTEETISNIYFDAWSYHLKGVTVYRSGSRSGILVKTTKPKEFNRVGAPKRPETLEADYYEVKARGEAFIVIVGLYDGRPYEIFVFRPLHETKVGNHRGTITKKGKGKYVFTSEHLTISDLLKTDISVEEKAATLYTSMLLRHGVDIKYIVKTAKKVDDNITSFSSAMCRVLNKYTNIEEVKGEVCPECGGRLIKEGGCVRCIDCSYSKCLIIIGLENK